MSKVTEWYPASVKPVHIGFYTCRYASVKGGFTLRRWWSGREWLMSPQGRPSTFGWKGDQWRGLAEKPA